MVRFLAASAVLIVAASAAANETPRSELSRTLSVRETGAPDADAAPLPTKPYNANIPYSSLQ